MFFYRNLPRQLPLAVLLFAVSRISTADNVEALPESPLLIVNHFNNAKCCVYVDQLESVELEKGTTLEIDLFESENLLELSTGPTFAKLISIPVSSKKERYSVITKIIEYNNELYGFFPHVAGLDADFNLLWTTHFNTINYIYKHLFEPKPYFNFKFITGANIDKEDEVKFFLIYTRAKYFTNSNISELKGENRNISLGEVSVRLNSKTKSYLTEGDIIYGLPAGIVKITHRERRNR